MPEITDHEAQKTKANIIEAFDEDKHLLDRIQKQTAADPRGLNFLKFTLGADGAGISAHQILNKKLAAEGRKL